MCDPRCLPKTDPVPMVRRAHHERIYSRSLRFMQCCSLFKSFKQFNRSATFKTFQANADSKRSNRSSCSNRSTPSPVTKHQGTSETLSQLPYRPRDEQEERIRWNKVALFGLRLRRLPERLHSGDDERREVTRRGVAEQSGHFEDMLERTTKSPLG